MEEVVLILEDVVTQEDISLHLEDALVNHTTNSLPNLLEEEIRKVFPLVVASFFKFVQDLVTKP